jgi:hypothetical protein
MQRSVHDRIHLITSLADLHHTVYIEFYPGPCRDKCWCTDSVFLTEEAFAFVEPIFRRHTPNYDYYSFMELPRVSGVQVIAELTSVALAIRAEPLVAPLSPSAAEAFELIGQGGSEEHVTVARLSERLATWLEREYADAEVVSVLGI